MSVNRYSNRNTHVYSPFKSPRYNNYNYASDYNITDRNVEVKQSKLAEKVQKLKQALKAAQKHNEQLHDKIRYYKQHNNQQIPQLQEEVKIYKKKVEELKKNHSEQIIGLRVLREDDSKVGRIGIENKMKEMEIQIKSKEMKIMQLSATVQDLNKNIKIKDSQIKQLSTKIDKYKIEHNADDSKKIAKMQDQLHIKATEVLQYSRENTKLKESLKDSVKKLQKTNLMLSEQTQKNKIMQDQVKQLKRKVEALQKQSTISVESFQKYKAESLEKVNLIRKLQKTILEHQFTSKRDNEKYQDLLQQNEKQKQEFKSLMLQFQALSSKYQEIVTTHYDLQRDLQRELHTIVKQLTRRHLVSKSLISNMGSSKIQQDQYNLNGYQLP